MPKGYDPVTKVLHWLVFLAVASQYAVGEFMPHIGRNTKDEGLVAIHMALGGFVLAERVGRAWLERAARHAISP